MRNITYISAGAGSGKTYKLTHTVVELLEQDPDFYPERLILTTFTKKAAAELMNEVRKLLCERGKYEMASRLDNALIGTVHSVGYQLLSKYWYYCNISPRMNILDDNALKGYIDSTLADCVTEEDIAFFNRLRFELKPGQGSKYSRAPFDWEEDVKSIIDKAHNFEVYDFEDSLKESLKSINQAYRIEGKISNFAHLKQNALTALDELTKRCKEITDRRSKGRAQKILTGIPALQSTVNNYPDNFQTYLSIYDFMNNDSTKVSGRNYETENIKTLKAALAKLRYAPECVEKYKQYVQRVFDIAKKWKDCYSEYKAKHNILDYNDIERRLIELLGNEEVLSEIKMEYRYLMVDEFQDSNSNQIKIFQILADNLTHSYWVGDSKQAIYGFRGTNTALIESITGEIRPGENGCERISLDKSHRSVPKLVEFSNAVFSQAFDGLKDVTLSPVREETNEICPLVSLKIEGRNNEDKFKKVAAYISNILVDPQYEKYTNNLSNFAILARKEDEVKGVAKELRKLNIPVSVAVATKETKEFELLKAILKLCENNKNNLAKATIAYLTSSDYPLHAIIDKKIEYDSSEKKEDKPWLSELQLLDKITKFSKSRRHLGITPFVTALIKELRLDNFSAYWEDGNEKVWNQIIKNASEYESMCIALGKPATLRGYLKSELDSKATELTDNAIQIMTYHKSKGLGWPVVTLLSLDDDIANEGKIINKEILGVRIEKNQESQNRLILLPKISTKDLHEKVKENLKEVIDAAKAKKLDEEKRLLYVGVTRAKDQLILITHKGTFNRFNELNLQDKSMFPTMETWTGEGVPNNKSRHIFLVEDSKDDFRDDCARYITPSKANETRKAERLCDIGERIKDIRAEDDAEMANFGNCLHQIYCCLENNQSRGIVNSLLEQYGFKTLKEQSETIISNWQAFVGKLTELYGSPVDTHHELGFKQVENGKVITGSIDYVWGTEKGDVIIDYKTFPGKPSDALDPQSRHYAGRYAGQFGYYRHALEQAGHKVLAQLVFYPSIGMLVKVE